MGYCVEADVKKRGGSYLNSTMPVTLNFDFSRAIETVSDEIDSGTVQAAGSSGGEWIYDCNPASS